MSLKFARSQFEKLRLVDQIDVLERVGIHMAHRSNTNYNIFLYYVWGIYVEVWYFKDTFNLTAITAISLDKVCDLYLHELELTELIK